MRVWKYESTDGGLEEHLKLHSSEPLPKASPTQHLIKVAAVALNPVDYKAPEAPLIGRLAVKKPATPCFDVAGYIITPADGSPLEPGQLVFGAANSNPLGGGALAEYVAAPANAICRVPSGISPLVAAGVPVAATTAFASLIPYISKGSRVFINGGSGGVGTYAIQIAKAAEAHVTVSCGQPLSELLPKGIGYLEIGCNAFSGEAGEEIQPVDAWEDWQIDDLNHLLQDESFGQLYHLHLELDESSTRRQIHQDTMTKHGWRVFEDNPENWVFRIENPGRG